MNAWKENGGMGNNNSQTVKLEPTEFRLPQAPALAPSSSINVKAEKKEANVLSVIPKKESDAPLDDPFNAPLDVPEHQKPEAANATAIVRVDPNSYTIYESAADIEYTPEHALQQGVKMINKMASQMDKLKLGPRRKEVWSKETATLRGQGAPSTLIAICGATGAGKSSLLNAVLDDQIVPTSGMRACTAVVTEISYHTKKTIDADISFLSREDWKAELDILLGDLIEEDGTIKRTTDLKSDAGIAWSKVHAVYPTISQETLVTMTADQIIAKDPMIAKILGTTKTITAKNSQSFAVEIQKYIDSKDRKGGKDKKDKEKKKANTPAFWPLIKQVNVRCSATALATGAILVDLPGTGDVNAARNSIAKNYMKRSNCIWILAPITRAVDDKIAKDLLGEAFKSQLMMDQNYNDSTVTFIATKCDDISCSEVIPALGLDDEPELEEIQEKIEHIADQTSEYKKKRSELDGVRKSLDPKVKHLQAVLEEHEEHLEALKDGRSFVLKLTGPKSKAPKGKKPKGKKRKNSRGDKPGSPKRRRSDSFVVDDDDDDNMSSSDDETSDFRASHDEEDGSDDEEKDSDADELDSDQEDVEDVEEDVEEHTEESVGLKIKETKALLKETRERRNDARKQRNEVADALAALKQKGAKAQQEKNAFCSLKRSEHSRDVLKEDFRAGLKDLDDAAAEARDPANFDPSVALRDYDAIDLPVFTASSRDYVRIKGQVKGDGAPSCFTNVRDTGIPEIQQWCHSLTKTSRERAAKHFVQHLAVFAQGVKQYINGIGDVTTADRETLRENWESGVQDLGEQLDDEDPFAHLLGQSQLYTLPKVTPKVDQYGDESGITPRLVKEFGEIVEESVAELKEHLRDGLEERCKAGAEHAASAAVSTSDDFASSMHWGSYRATLRRNGDFRRNLNVELVNPFTRHIAKKWQEVFEADVFSPLLSAIIACIDNLISDVEKSAASGLKDRAKLQGEQCMEHARVALQKTIETVKETLNNQQKEVSRSLAPHVQGGLLDGYSEAMEHRGTGSVARQKAAFRQYMVDVKDDIFEGGVDEIMKGLSGAAEAVRVTLKNALDNLANTIEVSIAVLWERMEQDPAQVKVQLDVVHEVNKVLRQLDFFKVAEKARYLDGEDVVMT
ncbi:hypothetical protein FB45DRAFT_988699 [Roridomyces roridus]|uniref:Nuclear GTPase SLIP-GC n=1 Tax=Roridomyces roridus TaxID=1738132 RepID=A0AAD7FUZ0_9AGAR|nr:hypothetical protein FB45DRAFT_988699 [Roridomyces roridus]